MSENEEEQNQVWTCPKCGCNSRCGSWRSVLAIGVSMFLLAIGVGGCIHIAEKSGADVSIKWE